MVKRKPAANPGVTHGHTPHTNHTATEHKRIFRGHFSQAQVVAERKKFIVELTKISTMPQKLADTLAYDFDRITELQKLDVALGKSLKEADFKRTVKSILRMSHNHGVRQSHVFDFGKKLPGRSVVTQFI